MSARVGVGGRTRVLQAAREVFRDLGIEGFSMRRVAQRANLSATAIYRHFPDKAALLGAVIQEGLAGLDNRLAPLRALGDPLERIRKGAIVYAEFAMSHPRHYAVMFLTQRESVPEVWRFPEGYAAAGPGAFRFLLDAVRQAIEDRILRADDPLETTLTIWAECHGLVMIWLAGRFGPRPTLFLDHYRRAVDRVIHGLHRAEA